MQTKLNVPRSHHNGPHIKQPLSRSLKSKLAKLNANDRTLLIAYINASLATQDGHIPNSLRVDHNTFELYAICPVPEGSEGVVRMLRPILTALRAAKGGRK